MVNRYQGCRHLHPFHFPHRSLAPGALLCVRFLLIFTNRTREFDETAEKDRAGYWPEVNKETGASLNFSLRYDRRIHLLCWVLYRVSRLLEKEKTRAMFSPRARLRLVYLTEKGAIYSLRRGQCWRQNCNGFSN